MKPIVINNIETDYCVDTDGSVYNKKTKKYLKGTILNTGYRDVLLTVKGVKKHYSVHRLVAIAYIPNPDNLPIVNHIDGNKTNNNVNNLEWVNQSENVKHAIESNLNKLAFGKRTKIDNIDFENWKQYKNTNYFVSKDGSIWNSKTKCLLKQTPNNSGYIRYTLRIDNKSVHKQAHILVMEVWGNREILSGEVINHIDGNKINNSLDNLEIVSKSENMIHACYTLNKNVKAVIYITDNGESLYPSLSAAARYFGITPGAIVYAIKNNSKCCNGYWKYK